MIDLHEPEKKIYTPLEEAEVTRTFLVMVHLLLMLYLSLHNVLIPFCLNLLRERGISQDIHLWFLFQLPLGYWLRRKKMIPQSYVLFLIFGSLGRLVFYNLFLFSKSWSLVSVYLSELSSLIFCFLIWSRSFGDKFWALSILGLLVPVGVAQWETHPVESKGVAVQSQKTGPDYRTMGCEGSEVLLQMPAHELNEASSVSLINCGFEHNLLRLRGDFMITQKLSKGINLRLYQLIHREGRYSWKFVRMKRLEKSETWVLHPLLKDRQVYLLKAPENRQLGMTVLLTGDVSLPGKFTMTFDSLNWSSP